MKNNKSTKEAYFERLNELAQSKKPLKNESKRGMGDLIDYKRAIDGVAYGIVKENHNYYIKKGGLKQNPNISDFAYIGGLANIKEYQYSSLAEAEKQRNFLFQTINESFNFRTNKSSSKLVNETVEEGAKEEIGAAEEKMGDLDTATAAAEQPPAEEPTPDFGGIDNIEVPADDAPAGGEPEGSDLPVPDKTVPLPAEPEGGADAEISAEPELGGGEEMPEEPTDGDTVEPELGGGEEGKQSITIEEIEKSLGKLTEKIRKTELTDSQAKGYLKTFIAAFSNELPDMEIEDRKEIANKILKVVPQDDVDDVANSVPQDDGEEMPVAEENTCAECGGFGKYAESRGYTMESLMEAGDDEIGSLVSGYANAFGEGQNDGDFKLVALFANPEILSSLKDEYGHEDYAEKLTPYSQEMNECGDIKTKIAELWNPKGMPVGSVEAQPNMMKEEEEIETDKEIPEEPEGGEELPVEPEPEGGEELSIEPEPEGGEESTVNIAPDSANLGLGVMKPSGAPIEIEEPEKSGGKEIEIKDSTVNITVNENFKMEMPTEAEEKLRSYIRSRLQEKVGLKKSTINESEKPKLIKKLDELIDKQLKLYETTVKKNKSVK